MTEQEQEQERPDRLQALIDEYEKNPNVHPSTMKVGEVEVSQGGLTLRDHFAGQALPAVYADAVARLVISRNNIPFEEFVARAVYDMADAMLARRKRTLE